jgi:hypothetical protein
MIALLEYKSVMGQQGFNEFRQFYPIGDYANFGFKSRYVKSESIVFEANPIIRYSISNNIKKNLLEDKDRAHAYYISFRPQIRMYTDSSLPVKMPSYRILFGTQQVFRSKKKNLFTISYESGHYSNGQSGCALDERFVDGSHQCDSIFRLVTDSTDLSGILNRTNGNYSTNLTEILFNYRFNKLDDDMMPERVHSFKAGATIYHNGFLYILPFGGFSKDDIKIYGRMRYHLHYEYFRVLKSDKTKKETGEQKQVSISFTENFELISGAHKSVNPIRNEIIFTIYPIGSVKEFGVFVSWVTGHDNYNYRFVDSGNVIFGGIHWHIFPPIAYQSGK